MTRKSTKPKNEPTGSKAKKIETARRAAVLRRYVGLKNPAPADTANAIAELGLSAATFRLLLRAWRVHGADGLAPKAAYPDPHRIRLAAEAAKGEPDLTEVAPVRRAETMRRIGVIGRWLRVENKDRKGMKAFADEFGTSVAAFERTVRAWIVTPTAASIPYARIVRSEGRGGLQLDPAVHAIVRRTLEDASADTPVAELNRRIDERCRAAGVDPPAAETVYLKALRHRSSMSRSVEGADIDVCLDRLVMLVDPQLPATGPTLVLRILFARPSGRILAHALSGEDPRPEGDASLIVGHLDNAPDEGPAIQLTFGLPRGPEWNRLRSALREGGIDFRPAPRRAMNSARFAFRTIGNRIGHLRMRRLEPQVAARLTRDPVLLDLAAAIVDQAVAEHNARRPPASAPIRLTVTPELAAQLLKAEFDLRHATASE